MPSTCREVRLGIAAQWWFEQWMKGYYLPSLALERINFDDGIFSTWLPVDLLDEIAQCFESGWRFQSKVSDCWPRQSMTDFLLKNLNSHPECMWVFEDPLGRPDDGWLEKSSPTNIVRSTEHIYFVLTKSMPADIVSRTVDLCMPELPPMVGICTTASAVIEGGRLRNETLPELAHRVEALVIGAYDGEGFVAWQRAGQ